QRCRKQARYRGEDIPPAEVQGQLVVVAGVGDSVVLGPDLEMVAATDVAERLQQLNTLVQAEVWSEALASDGGEAQDLQGRSALIVSNALAPAARVEGVDVLLLVRVLRAGFVDPIVREDIGLGSGHG